MKLIRENTNAFVDYITVNSNDSIKTSKFPDLFKVADIEPVHKKDW